MAKVFIGGLSWNTNDDSLRSAFEKYGEITDARVIVDRNTGRSRGFGFVSFAELDCARDAISAMNNKELDGREVRVDLAQDRPEGGSRGGRSGPYDRPSYGGGGGGRREYGGGNWRDNNGGGRGGYRGGRDGDDGGSRREYSGSRGGGRDYDSRSSNRSYDD